MKTMTIEEAKDIFFGGVLYVHDRTELESNICGTESWGKVSEIVTSDIFVAFSPSKAQAHILAHCFNRFQEVVNRLKWYMEQEEELMYYGPIAQNETQRVLAEAQTVIMPE